MTNSLKEQAVTEKPTVQEVNCGFSAHGDKLTELLRSNDLSEMEKLLHQSLFESLVSNLMEAEKRLKNSSDKDYKKNFTVYESLLHQCSSFILKDVENKRDRNDLVDKVGWQIAKEVDDLFAIIIDLIEAFRDEVENSRQINFTGVCVGLDEIIMEMDDPVQKTFERIIDIIKTELNRYFISKNLLNKNK